MNEIDLDGLAYIGGTIPDGLDSASALRFLMLRALYRFAKVTDMPREDGAREKRYIESVVAKYRADIGLSKHYADVLLLTGRARTDYRKARYAGDDIAALDAADRMTEALDNISIPRKDVNET